MWRAIRENPRAVMYAVLMHLVLLVLLVISLDWTPKVSTPAQQPIQARLVDSEQLEKSARAQADQQKLAEDKRKKALEAQQQAEAEKRRKAEQLKAAAEKKQQAEVAAKQKAEAEKKQKAEAAAKQKAEAEKQQKAELAAKQKTEVEKKKQAELEAKRKAEAERKQKAERAAQEKAAAAARQREAEQALQAQLAAEQEEERTQGIVDEYVGYIQEKVKRNWLEPPGGARGLFCVVQVSLIPGGDVVKVQMVRSSGDAVFDRSVEIAVFKAAPLPLPKDPAVFNRFREIKFRFKPD